MRNAGHGKNAIYGITSAGIKKSIAELISFATAHGRNVITLRISASQKGGIVIMILIVEMSKNVTKMLINVPLLQATAMMILTAIFGRTARSINAN